MEEHQRPSGLFVQRVLGGIRAGRQQGQKEHLAVTLANPTVGLYSPTDASKGITLKTTFVDRMNEILFGKQPVSAFDDLVNQWRTSGGDKIRSEYEQAFQASTDTHNS